MRIEGLDVRDSVLAVGAISLALVALTLLVAADDADAGSHAVELALNDTSNIRYVDAGEPAYFNFTLKDANGSNSYDDIIIDVLDEPDTWWHLLAGATERGVRSSTNELELRLSRNETSNMGLRSYPPEDAPNGTYWMMIVASLKGDDSINDSLLVCVVIGRFDAFEFWLTNEPSEGHFAAIPPSKFTLILGLRNTGRTDDRYRISCTSSRESEGWTVTPDGTSVDSEGWTPTLRGDPSGASTYTVSVNVWMPMGAAAGARCRIEVVATSSIGPPYISRTADATVEALQFYDFQVYTGSSDKKDGSPGEQVAFMMRIWNRGNGYDNFTSTAMWDEELNPGFDATVEPRVTEVAPDGSATVYLLVNVPESAAKKVYFFTVEVLSSSPDLAIVTKSFEVEVGQSFKIALRSPEPRMSTLPGGILDYQVYVRNAGNGIDSMAIRVDGMPANWLAHIQPWEVSLLQGEEALTSIRIIVPSHFEEVPAMHYDLTVVAESHRSDAQCQLVLGVDVIQFFVIDWMFADRPITDMGAPTAKVNIITPMPTLNPYEVEWFEMRLELKNRGNGVDNVTFEAMAVDPRVTITVAPSIAMLQSNQTFTTTVRVTVPRDLPLGLYRFQVDASSQDPALPTRSVPMDFMVYHVDVALDPVPTYRATDQSDRPLGGVKFAPDTGVSLRLRVTNLGTRPVGPVLIRAYDVHTVDGQVVRWNFLNITTPQIHGDGTLLLGAQQNGSDAGQQVIWWANVTGQHTLEFRAFLDNQNDTSNDLSTADVIVLEWPPDVEPPLLSSTASVALVIMATAFIALAGWARGNVRGRRAP